jgi:hypothetical protein
VSVARYQLLTACQNVRTNIEPEILKPEAREILDRLFRNRSKVQCAAQLSELIVVRPS